MSSLRVQDRARPDFQAGPGRREELAAARWSPPLAEGDPRGHLHRWRRGRQPTSSSRCRLTPTVTNIRRYLARSQQTRQRDRVTAVGLDAIARPFWHERGRDHITGMAEG